MNKYILLIAGLITFMSATATVILVFNSPNDIFFSNWETSSLLIIIWAMAYTASYFYLKYFLIELRSEHRKQIQQSAQYLREQRQMEEDALNSQAWESYIKQVQYDLENNQRDMYMN